jgi:dTDP-4-amino-4,6-dideoxygalactose transaminase
VAASHGLVLIEDAAHCVEGVSNAGKVGVTADFTCFSFYATKNISTGEGGMVTTPSEDAAAFIRTASLHGLSRDGWARYAKGGTALYDVVTPGFKYNMMDIQAALGTRQLERLEEFQVARARVWAIYDVGLDGLGLELPRPCPPGVVHARHLYQVLVDPARCGWTRDGLAEALAAEGIGTSVHFRPVHLFSYYAERFGYRQGAYPHAERVADETLSLPLSGAMTADDAERVVETVRQCLRRRAT